MCRVQHVIGATFRGVPPEYFVSVSGIPPDCYFGKTSLCFFVYLKEAGIRGYVATVSNPEIFIRLPEETQKEILRPATERGAIFES